MWGHLKVFFVVAAQLNLNFGWKSSKCWQRVSNFLRCSGLNGLFFSGAEFLCFCLLWLLWFTRSLSDRKMSLLEYLLQRGWFISHEIFVMRFFVISSVIRPESPFPPFLVLSLDCKLNDRHEKIKQLIWRRKYWVEHAEWAFIMLIFVGIKSTVNELYSVTLETACWYSLLFSSCRVKRPFHLPPAALTLLPFPVQCHDRSLQLRSELDNYRRALSAVVQAFPAPCLTLGPQHNSSQTGMEIFRNVVQLHHSSRVIQGFLNKSDMWCNA